MAYLTPRPMRGAKVLGSNPVLVVCVLVLAAMVLMAILGPWLLGYGSDLDPLNRLEPPGPGHWFGTDNLGRNIFVRTVSGSRVSIIVGIGAASITMLVGGALGLVSGYTPTLDRVLMRVMDGFMAIPGVLLAIALVSVLGSGLLTVIIAISVPEIPRTARLMRSVVLTVKTLPFVDAAVSVGTSPIKILIGHIVPNAMGALIVQATFVCASAILSESILSFLGVGIRPEVPSWGNVMAIGRQYFQLAPWIIGFPGLFLSLLVLSINILGDRLRDRLDPRRNMRRER